MYMGPNNLTRMYFTFKKHFQVEIELIISVVLVSAFQAFPLPLFACRGVPPGLGSHCS